MIQMSSNAVVTEKLTRRYGYRVALKAVSLEFSEGGIHGLFGANGAGKTTLLRVISLLLRPHEGLIRVFGVDPQEDPEIVKKDCGLIGDKPLLYSELTGRENLHFYGKLYSLAKDIVEKQVVILSDYYDVSKWLDEPVKNLSTGLRKRLDIVRSLLHNPRLLLLDEPFSGLDKESTRLFREYLEQERKNRTTILTTHNLALGSELCDDFVTLRKGAILSQGPIHDFDQVI
jgi:ABC-type multidrug transport system ATPase subunit